VLIDHGPTGLGLSQTGSNMQEVLGVTNGICLGLRGSFSKTPGAHLIRSWQPFLTAILIVMQIPIIICQ